MADDWQPIDDWTPVAAANKPRDTGPVADPNDIRTQLRASPIGALQHGAMEGVYGGLQLGGKLESALTSLGGLAPNPVSRYIDRAVSDLDKTRQLDEATYQAARKATGGNPESFDVGRLIGNAASPVNAVGGEVGALARGLPYGARLGRALLEGGYYGASQPVEDTDNFWKEKGLQVATGTGTGGALHGAGVAAGRVISPEIRAQARLLLDQGVPLTVGQTLGGSVQRLEDAGTSIPFVGDMIRNRQREAVAGWRNAAINRSLEHIGAQLPPNTTGRDAIDYAATSISNRYNQLFPQMTGHLDPQLNADTNAIIQNAVGMGARPETVNRFTDIMRTQIGERAQGGVLPGQAIHDAWQNLGEASRRLSRSQDADDQALADMIQDAQGSFGQMLERHNPGFANDLRDTNTAFANFVRVRRAASSVGAREGEFSPAQLANAVRNSDASAGHGQYARGNALMQDLSDAGHAVLPSTVPDSGTPLRHAIQLGLGLAGADFTGNKVGIPGTDSGVAGAAALGALLAAGGTRGGQALLRSALTRRPQNAPAIANAVQQLAPRGAAALVPLLLNQSPNTAPK